MLFDTTPGIETRARDAFWIAERILAGKQALGCALAAIEDLPPRCREAFTLHRFNGLQLRGRRPAHGYQRQHGGKTHCPCDAADRQRASRSRRTGAMTDHFHRMEP